MYALAAAQPLMAIDWTITGALRGAGDSRLFHSGGSLAGFYGMRLTVTILISLLRRQHRLDLVVADRGLHRALFGKDLALSRGALGNDQGLRCSVDASRLVNWTRRLPRVILFSVAETQHATETLEGTLDQVLFVNDKNGYSVAVVVVAGEHGVSRRVTVVGNLAGLEVGSTIRAEGGYEKHPRFGEQFHVVDFETLRPAGSVAIERYLASEIKGVGPAFARRIAEHFGDELGEVLDNAPERMREVPGIGAARARLIAATWRDSSGLREVTVFLRGHGLGGAHARRIHKFYGKHALEVVQQDPYVLARTIHGIGFRTADAIAEKLGIARNSIQRARAAVLYLLERMADEGHVYSPLEYLEGQFRSALEMEPDLARDAVGELAAGGDVIVEQAAGRV